MTAPPASQSSPITVEEPGNGRLEVFPLPTDAETLETICRDVFEQHWQEIFFGTMVQGSVFEIKATNPPHTVGMLDGYLTVDFGPWHFHLCIGDNWGSKQHPTPENLRRRRKTARAEMYRSLSARDGTPSSWGLRLFNGDDEQQLTVWFPNPFLSDEQKILKQPDFDRLKLWDAFRQRYLGLGPDPRDRAGTGFYPG